MAKWDLEKIREKNDKKGNNSPFDLKHHGDEVLVGTDDDGQIKMAIKIQTGTDSFRATLLTFESQTQCERLLPSILKGLKGQANG